MIDFRASSGPNRFQDCSDLFINRKITKVRLDPCGFVIITPVTQFEIRFFFQHTKMWVSVATAALYIVHRPH